MIRKTQPSAWTASRLTAIAALSVAVVFAVGVALSPQRPAAIAVIGDCADEVRAALGAQQAANPTVTVVLLDRWESLRHLPDIAELCWAACHDRVSGHIVLTRMRFGRTRKIVVFHLPSFDNDLGCVAARASQEVIALRADAPSCGAGVSRVPVWILPMGLGRLS